MSQQASSSLHSDTMPDHLWSAVTILDRLFPRTFGVIAMWKVIVDYPVLLCPCEDGKWCEWCEPTPMETPPVVDAPEGVLPAA